LNQRLTVGGLSFRNAAIYTISGPGEIALQSTAGDCLLESLQDGHDIRVNVQLHGNGDFQAENAAAMWFLGDFDLNSKTLRLRGPGAMHFGGHFLMHGGVLSLDGLGALIFDAAVQPAHDGILKYQPPENVELTPSDAFGCSEASNDSRKPLSPKSNCPRCLRAGSGMSPSSIRMAS
jgi:hypothetical protein